MAMAHPAHGADDCCELVKTQLRLNGPLSLRPKLPTISVIVLAMGLAGCARNPAHRELNLVQREVAQPLFACLRVSVFTPKNGNMSNCAFAGPTRRCLRPSRRPIASSREPISVQWTRMNGLA